MNNTALTLTTETEALKDVYAALNRNDISAIIRLFDPRIEWTDPSDSPLYGTYNGLAAVQKHFTEARSQWAEGSCEPERFIVGGDKVVVFVHVRVRLRHETEWREGRLGDVYTFRDGKVVHARSFLDRAEALKWAGIEHSETNEAK